MKIDELINKYDVITAPASITPNMVDIPVTRCDMNVDGAERFNEYFRACVNDISLNKLTRTPSGGICTKFNKLRLPAYDVVAKYTEKGHFSGVEITVITDVMCRIQFCGKPADVVSGTVAFREFKKTFKKFGINLDDYAVTKDEGKALKKEIEPPLIQVANRAYFDVVFEDAYHVDYNSSYTTGLVNLHPEFEEALQYMYKHRKVTIDGIKDYYKSVLNSSIGYMQSQYSGYKFTNLSRDAINDNNRRIRELAEKIKASGDIVLSYNTDGIWAAGKGYHDDNEGKDLGQWKTDHVNCTFRAKSDGAYEYMEDGHYYPVVRGATRLDRIKPRTEWEWGDIYNYDAELVMFRFDEKEGIIL